MWPESARSASDPVQRPPITSASIVATERPSARSRRRRLSAAAAWRSCPCIYPLGCARTGASASEVGSSGGPHFARLGRAPQELRPPARTSRLLMGSGLLHREGPAPREGDARALEAELVGVDAGLRVRGQLDEAVEDPAPGPNLEAVAGPEVQDPAAEADRLHEAADLDTGWLGRAEDGDEPVVELAARAHAGRDDLCVLDRKEGEFALRAAVLLRHRLRELHQAGALPARGLLHAPAQRRAAGREGREEQTGGGYLRNTHPCFPSRRPRAGAAGGGPDGRGAGASSGRACRSPSGAVFAPDQAPKGAGSGAVAISGAARPSDSRGAGQTSPDAST